MANNHGNNEIRCDIVVVGAGLSGLTCARELQKKAPNLKVEVVEAKDRVGGRTLTTDIKCENGVDQFDLGGHWFGVTQPHIINLIKEQKLETYAQYATGKKLAQVGDTTDIRPYKTAMPTGIDLAEHSIVERMDFLVSFHRIEKMVEQIDPLNVFAHPEAARWDGMTLEEWARQNCTTQTMIDNLNQVAEHTYGVNAKRLSLLWALYFAKAAGGFADLLQAEGKGAQSFRIKGGTQQMSANLAAELNNPVHLSTAVLGIKNTPEGLVLTTGSTAPGSNERLTFCCSRMVLAIPPSQCGKITFEPPLPYTKRQLFDGTPMGNFVKFIITYSTPFWRPEGFSGEVSSTGFTGPSLEVRPLLQVYDATTLNGNAAIVGFMHCDPWAEKTRDERKSAVIDDLQRFFGPQVRDFIAYEDKDWSKEPYSGGCPVSYIPAGNMNYFHKIREPIGRIHIGGTEAASSWPGYMTGAVQSGLRAAHELLLLMQPKAAEKKHLVDSVYADNYSQKPLVANNVRSLL